MKRETPIFVISILTSTYEVSQVFWGFGIFFILLGMILGGIMLFKKVTFWQIELKDKPGQYPRRWRIPQNKAKETAELIKLMKEKAAVNRS